MTKEEKAKKDEVKKVALAVARAAADKAAADKAEKAEEKAAIEISNLKGAYNAAQVAPYPVTDKPLDLGSLIRAIRLKDGGFISAVHALNKLNPSNFFAMFELVAKPMGFSNETLQELIDGATMALSIPGTIPGKQESKEGQALRNSLDLDSPLVAAYAGLLGFQAAYQSMRKSAEKAHRAIALHRQAQAKY